MRKTACTFVEDARSSAEKPQADEEEEDHLLYTQHTIARSTLYSVSINDVERLSIFSSARIYHAEAIYKNLEARLMRPPPPPEDPPPISLFINIFIAICAADETASCLE